MVFEDLESADNKKLEDITELLEVLAVKFNVKINN